MLLNKYNINFSDEVVYKNIQRLTNQLWKLIPMRENKESWEKQLDTVILELTGLNEIFFSPDFLQLLSKLEGLKNRPTVFEFYRKTIFECITLLQGLKFNESKYV